MNNDKETNYSDGYLLLSLMIKTFLALVFGLILLGCISMKPESKGLITDGYITENTEFVKIKLKVDFGDSHAVVVHRYSESGKMLHNTKRTSMVFVDKGVFNDLERERVYRFSKIYETENR